MFRHRQSDRRELVRTASNDHAGYRKGATRYSEPDLVHRATMGLGKSEGGFNRIVRGARTIADPDDSANIKGRPASTTPEPLIRKQRRTPTGGE